MKSVGIITLMILIAAWYRKQSNPRRI